MKKIRKNKHGSLFDIILISIVVFAVAIGFLFALYVGNSIDNNIQDMPEDQVPADAKAHLSDNMDRFPAVFDGLFLFVAIGASLGSMIGSFYIRSHPAVFLIATFILAVVVVLNAVLSNAFEAMATDPTLSASAGQFTVMPFVMSQFPLFMLIISIIIAIVLYAKRPA